MDLTQIVCVCVCVREREREREAIDQGRKAYSAARIGNIIPKKELKHSKLINNRPQILSHFKS